MLIREVNYEDKCSFRNGYELVVTTDDKSAMVRFLDGKPENAIISRDFSSVYSIANLIQMAYDAGRNGEPFEFKTREATSYEDFLS